MKIREFFLPKNFAERVVILQNCPKGRKELFEEWWVGNVGEKAVEELFTWQ